MKVDRESTSIIYQLSKLVDIKGIGPKIEHYFNNLGVFDAKDLLYYFPRDYEEFQEPTRITDLVVGQVSTVKALIVTKPSMFRKGNVTITSVWLDDGTARIRAYWFNVPFINKSLNVGTHAYFRGKVSLTGKGFAFSQCKMYKEETYNSLKGNLSPVYSLTKGLTNNVIKKAVSSLLTDCDNELLKEYLPEKLLKERELCDLTFAFNHIHFPNKMEDMLIARKRLVYDELFIFSLAMLLSKDKTVRSGRAELKDIDESYVDRFVKALPYELTSGQKETFADIVKDFKSGKKMNRLIEGDVGSGKTIVAILAALLVTSKGMQVCIMAPTEVLAEQHYNLIKSLFDGKDYQINVGLLTGSLKSKERKETLDKIKNGELNIIVGTHALFSKDVEYKDLGLAIIDEQHRFGVNQRKALEEKSKNVAVIVMSATPIPRTLSMLLYADLDISILKDKPQNRLAIKNCIAKVSDREKAYKAIKKELDLDHQAYVICAAIDKNDDEDVGSFANYQNVVEYAENLKEYFGKSVSIAILHGKMKTEEKYEIMTKFKNGEIQILVSTTVVEVGVDVPNATFIMIEDAGSFGLAELHQLRGRVGRGDAQSYALFVDTMPNEKSKERLSVLVNSNDGFYIAEEDLRLRGPGDIFGVKQSGDMDFRLADMYTDLKVFREAAVDAKEFINNGENLGQELKQKVEKYIENGYTI